MPDAGVPKDAPGNPGTGDAGTTGTQPGGCCNVDGGRGAAGSIVLALGTLLVLARRRATSSS